ncbi:NAD(P)-binding protein [Thozetella sp. PMI_491]|nr:NAD(P)-binding protein [Thozetella sp. PMI_491]
MTFHPDSLPNLSGKVYIVTGGNSGIGYATVARLAQHGAHVYLCARSPAKGTAAIATIKKTYPQANVSLLEMDHLSLASVVAAAKTILSKETTLHGLVNNAGIMATPFEISKDGHEAQWQTNYLAHWVFTHHLLPLMRTTAKGLPAGSVRIVNLSSSGHFAAPQGGINFTDTSLTGKGGMTRYGQSKLANVLHAKALNKLYGPGSAARDADNGEVWTAIVHPGVVKTEIGSHAEISGLLKGLVAIYGSMGGAFSSDKGSWTGLFCVASPDMKKEQSGTYFQRIAEAGWESESAKNIDLAEKLERWTEEQMGKEGWLN